jgi:hypothetical protein
MKGGTVAHAIQCAEFVGGNQEITYGYSADDVERLITRVLEFLQNGAAFLPRGDQLHAEWNGNTLTFSAGAVQQLTRRRDERSYLLALTVHKDYQIWATKFIPLKAQVDLKRAVEGLELPVAYSEFRSQSWRQVCSLRSPMTKATIWRPSTHRGPEPSFVRASINKGPNLIQFQDVRGSRGGECLWDGWSARGFF